VAEPAGAPRLRALLIDYGGVLTTAMGESFAEFAREHDIKAEALLDFLKAGYVDGGADDHPVSRVETGRMELEEFETHLAEALSVGRAEPLDPAGLRDRLFAVLRPDDRMLEAVRRLREAGVKVALVSNSWGPAGYPRDELDTMFDAVLVSGEVGVRKPDRDIFLLAAERLGVEPAACVFVDDIGPNVEGAKAVGMHGIHHRTAGQTLAALELLFGVPLAEAGG